MGQVCAKNDAGRVATDAPKPKIKREEKQITSTQQLEQPYANDAETKYVRSELNFNIDKGVDKKADQVAMEVANQWCSTNSDWTYTGQWKNVRTDDGQREVSLFHVRRTNVSGVPDVDVAASSETIIGGRAELKIAEDLNRSKKNTITDVKQSFVDQVAEGLALKVAPERYTKDDDGQDETQKSTPPTGPATAEKSKDGSNGQNLKEMAADESNSDQPHDKATQ